MKILKIIIIVGVVSVIAFIMLSVGGQIKDPQSVKGKGENKIIKGIKLDIDSIPRLPDSSFQFNDFYRDIERRIENRSGTRHFGKTLSDRKNKKENFTRDLYTNYTNKFIRQSFIVFRRPSWKADDMKFIRSEVQALRQSGMLSGTLKKNSNWDKDFEKIENIIKVYDSINVFIKSCKGFSHSNYNINAIFPIPNDRIASAGKYQSRKFELEGTNDVVLLCKDIQRELAGIPEVLFNAHFRYLDRKIGSWSNKYDKYCDVQEYIDSLRIPLRNQAEVFKGVTAYGVSYGARESKYGELMKKWNNDGDNAAEFDFGDEEKISECKRQRQQVE